MIKIRWFGHSCFSIEGEITLLIDPPSPDARFPRRRYKADIVLITHDHSGHSGIGQVEGDPWVIRGPGEYEISDIFILGFKTFHDPHGGRKLGKNTIYLIEMEGVRLCHLGDLGHPLPSSLSEELGNPDVLFIPVGGKTTLPVPKAVELIGDLGPKIVVPMHFRSKARPDLEPPDAFLRELGKPDIAPQQSLSISRSRLPEETEVVLLSPPKEEELKGSRR